MSLFGAVEQARADSHEEGKRDGVKLGWAAAIEEVMRWAARRSATCRSSVLIDHLREKASKLP